MRTVTVFASAALLATTAFGQTASDDFNRPDSTNMGPDWIEQAGDTIIESNMGKGKDPFIFKGFMSHATLTGEYQNTVQSVDFQCNGSGQGIILLSGLNPNTWGAVSVKLQDNDGDMMMDRLFFEQAFNAGSWGSGNPVIYDLLVPTATGRLTVSFSDDGDTVFCAIENDTSGNTEDASANGINSFAFPIIGTNLGIGHSGNVSFDNWTATVDSKIYGSGCPGTGGLIPSLTASNDPVVGSPVTLTIEDGLANGSALLFFGLSKTSVPVGGGCQLLITPVLAPVISIGLDGSGNGSVFGIVPASAAGTTFTMQAFIPDAGNPIGASTTNGLEFIVP